MKKTMYTLPKRILAMLLSLVLILSVMPVLGLPARAAGTTATVADANTMDEWQNAFLPNGLPSTDYAGAIWTDKTVMTAGSDLPAGVSVDADNFLIALSALATNSTVVGSGSVPTDTVFILDASNSMDATELEATVVAANSAISTLLAENDKSRVAVIVFNASASVLMPLDHYTGATTDTVTTPTYLSYSNGAIYPGIRTQSGRNYTFTGITNSQGVALTEANAVSSARGTYIQSGLWAAWQQLDAVTTQSIAENKTIPAIILMSDGAPTYSTASYNNVGSAGNNNLGTTEGDGFITQLTAAYIKAMATAKYGKCLMYTVGFGLDTATDQDIAQEILDPTGTSTLWTTYNNLAAGGTMSVTLTSGRSSITKSALSLTPDYVDSFFEADDATSLNDAFQSIVNEIALQTGYYPTRTDDNGINYSGYITFSDTIGKGMEVKSIKGIYLDGTLYDGHKMAQVIWQTDQNINHGGNYAEWLGTMENPTNLGDELVRAVKTRMGITADTTAEANAIAWALIDNAWTTGQLSYTDEDTFSNYIAWYGDASGKYVGPYTEGGTAPAGAAYINFCYGMLGVSTAFGLESDMMFIAIQVSYNIKTQEQMVTFRIPAALLPTLTYQVDVQLDEYNNVIADSATIFASDETPIVLLYEVGVDESVVNPLTVHNYGTPTGDGRYYLYTNAFGYAADTMSDSTTNDLTYAHFEPGPDNEHYYFSDDTLLYVKSGDSFVPYTGTAAPTAGVYFADVIYTATGTPTNGVYQANVHTEYVRIADQDLAENAPIRIDGSWYMPAGAMYANTYNYDLAKTANITGTYSYVHHHEVEPVASDSGIIHYELMYQGNNGRLTYEPAQGIVLTKELAADATALEGREFTFTLRLAGDSDNTVFVSDAAGQGQDRTLTAGALTLTLTAGQSIYITGIDTGATYTVTEAESYDYQVVLVNGVSATQATGTVAAYAVTPVTFTNDTVDYGAFTVEKLVTYHNGTSAQADYLAPFTLDITLAGYANKSILVDGQPYTTDASGKITVTIRDQQIITLSRVPVGTAYTVTERAPTAAGYAFEGFTDTVDTVNDGRGTVAVHTTGVTVHNSYTPTNVPLAPAIEINGSKLLVDADGNATDWHGNTFSIRLLRWNAAIAQWEDIPSGTAAQTILELTQADPTFTLPLTEEFSQVGSYWYRIEELEGTAESVTYDQTRRVFRVRVTDNDLDGQLEMTVENAQNTEIVSPAGPDQAWVVNTAQFHNIYAPDAATWTLTARKVLQGRALQAGEFTFRLEAVTADAPMPTAATSYEVTSGQRGNIVFPAIVFTHAMEGNTYEYTLTEIAGTEKGVTYDDTVYRIFVTVSDDGGAVAVTASYTKDGASATDLVFTNTYAPEAVVAGPFNAFKTMTDRTPGAQGPMDMTAGQFRFLLEASASADPMPEGAENGSLTLYNDAQGNITIPSITYTQPGDYIYTLSEVDLAQDGYTYDTEVYTITVIVADDGEGRLVITSATFAQADGTHVHDMTFANSYQAEPVGDIILRGTKTLQIADKNLSRALKDGEFTFLLSDANGVLQRVTNTGNTFAFSALRFDRAGTYTYTVTEEAGDLGGITYDSTVYKLVITVVDGGAGQLIADIMINGQETNAEELSVSFINHYDVTALLVPVTATKTMSGRRPQHGEFHFTLTAGDGAPMPANTENGTLSVSNGYRGEINFGHILYEQAGTYTYTLREEAGSAKGVTYDDTVYTLTVTVTDDGAGALTAATAISGGQDSSLTFRNTYKPDPVTVNLTGENNADGIKELTDTAGSKTLKDFELHFILKAEDGTVIETVKDNDTTGFNFADITYTEAQTAVYYIEEAQGAIPGMTYDAAVYKVTVTVTDDQQGRLSAALAYEKLEGDTTAPAEAVIFRNSYTEPTQEPPATEPPATEPPATEPPATGPAATEPAATEPPASQPTTTEPPVEEIPKTADATCPMAWLLMMSVSAVSMVAVLLMGTKKHTR